MISECISEDIPPKIKILNYGYPHSTNSRNAFSAVSSPIGSLQAARHPTICDVINDVKLFPHSISQDILSQIFDVIQSAVTLQNQVH